MMKTDFDREWQAAGDDLSKEMREWRLGHPKATLSEMESALDKPLAELRAKLLQDMALASENADLRQVPRVHSKVVGEFPPRRVEIYQTPWSRPKKG